MSRNNKRKRIMRSKKDLLFMGAMQFFTRGEGMDPLLLMSHVVGERAMRDDTLIGDKMYSTMLEVVTNDEEEEEDRLTLDDFYEMARSEMMIASSPSDGGCGCCVRPIPKLKILTDPILKVFASGKKKEVLDELIKKCEESNVNYCFASMVQIVYPSGARVHEIYSHPSEFLISCRDKILDHNHHHHRGGGKFLSLVEVPNSLQLLHCFYVDWDMMVNDFKFLSCGVGGGGESYERKPGGSLDFIRSEAMKTPCVIYGIMAKLGYIRRDETVQVVVVEGTRWNEKKKSHKVSIHFIFKVLSTRLQYKKLWGDIISEISSSVPGCFDEVIRKRDEGCVDSGSVEAMGSALFPLIGMDMHPFQNVEQGLALPFSRKTESDPVSRPMAIIHVKGGEEIMWEIPCREIWRAGNDILGRHPKVEGVNVNPSSVLSCLLDCSICIPGPRCVGITTVVPTKEESPSIPGGGGEDSMCSVLSSASTTIFDPTATTIDSSRKMGFSRMNQSLRSRVKDIKNGKSNRGSTIRPLQKRGPGVDGDDGKKIKRLKKKEGEEGNDEEEGPRSADAVLRSGIIPDWFIREAKSSCGDGVFESSNVYFSPRYGSRPSFAKKGGLFFQMNKSKMAICCRSLMTVPFRGHRCHASNGALFYADGEGVYVSCMKSECRGLLLKERERYFCMALRIRRLLEGGEEGCCVGSGLGDYCNSVLTAEDLKFLGDVSEKKEAGTCKLDDHVMVRSTSMNNSVDGKRTWVRLDERILRCHLLSS